MSPRRAVVALAALALLGSAARAQGQEPEPDPLQLEGTWHVLVHYQDQASAKPDQERWEDRVWVFRKEPNGRMRWTDYPIVVLDNQAGRFGSVAGNPRARILHYWEPSPAQLEELRQGPKVNSRGSRSKKLERTEDGWRSTGSALAESASVIRFSATWTIEKASSLPLFKMEDVLGSALTDSMEGSTSFVTEQVEPAGDVLRGRYDRDGTRVGTFRMLRTAPARGLGTEEEQRQRIRQRAAEAAGALQAGEDEPPPAEEP